MEDKTFRGGIPRRLAEAGILVAPWSPSEVAALAASQANRSMHPFTCPENHSREDRVLVPTLSGWTCKVCDYTQDWCHQFQMRERPGLFYSDPTACTRGTFWVETVTPYELLRSIAMPIGQQPRFEYFRVVFPRTRHDIRLLPWNFLDTRFVPRGKLCYTIDEGGVYEFETGPTIHFIVANWTASLEAAAQRLVQRYREIVAAQYNLKTELGPALAARDAPLNEPGPVMTGTFQLLADYAHRQIFAGGTVNNRSATELLSEVFLTPALLLDALTRDPARVLPDFIRFPPNQRRKFPWYEPEPATKPYVTPPFPTTYRMGLLPDYAEPLCFKPTEVIPYLQAQVDRAPGAERAARNVLVSMFKTGDGGDFIEKLVARVAAPYGQ